MNPTTDSLPIAAALLPVADASPQATEQRRVRLGMAISVITIHLVALVGGIVFFSWAGVLAAFILAVVVTNLGISAGYHRLLVHRGYVTPGPIRYFLSLCGTLALQGGPLSWSATHRLHHQHAEDEKDPHSPHSPKSSFLWGHMMWFFYTYPTVEDKQGHWKRYVPDLYKEPALRFMERFFIPLNVAFAFMLFGLGYAIGGWYLAASLVVWGFFVRIVFVWHATWFVNSAAHMWGYRNYNTPDQSRNNWWVALITSGEGWHNNHHADPRSASHGHKWWEIDPTFTFLRTLETVGLVKELVRPEGRKTNNAPVTAEHASEPTV